MTIIREIREDDAENFLSLCKQLDEESKFMLLEPGERKTTAEEQRQWTREALSTDNQVIFVAEEQGSRRRCRCAALRAAPDRDQPKITSHSESNRVLRRR